jgi:formylglycine-generating enzyme required for sulfatase activity
MKLPGGTFTMGSDQPTFPQDGEGPAVQTHVGPFAIDVHAVTNQRFAAFVATTGYVTDAERAGSAFVFYAHVTHGAAAEPVPNLPWWREVKGACWNAPEGPGSNLTGRNDHPVVQVSWNDARAFARWAGGRLPSEAEWEYAARGGLEGARYAWGDELESLGRHMMNVWQGEFPTLNTAEDGHAGVAPVGSFPPNGYGLHEVCGNVWEWCEDRFDARLDLTLGEQERVQKGGSFLCHASYCDRYRPAARSHASADTATQHAGFRLVYDDRDD